MRNYAKRWSLAFRRVDVLVDRRRPRLPMELGITRTFENVTTAPTYWIAAVSAAEEFLKHEKHKKERNKRKGTK